MAGKCQATGTCNAWAERNLAGQFTAFLKKRCQCFLNICIMSLIISKQDIILIVDNGDFYGSGTNVDSESVDQIHVSGINPNLLY